VDTFGVNLYSLVADKIVRDPGVVRTALTTLAKWEALGEASPARLAAWRRLLCAARRGRAGRRRLLAVLRDDSLRNRRRLDFAPFAGVLTREERRKIFLKCTFDH